MDIFYKNYNKILSIFSFFESGMEYDRFSWLDLSNYNILNMFIEVSAYQIVKYMIHPQ